MVLNVCVCEGNPFLTSLNYTYWYHIFYFGQHGVRESGPYHCHLCPHSSGRRQRGLCRSQRNGTDDTISSCLEGVIEQSISFVQHKMADVRET